MAVITGTSGNDTLNGTSGADIIYSQGGNDIVNGSDGDDEIGGGAGNDELNGGGDNDTIFGGLGRDTINGGSGSDLIFGGEDNDIIRGDDGNDTLIGGGGGDLMTGGSGADTFTFYNNHGTDGIFDFDPGEGDRIELGGSISSVGYIRSGFVSNGNDGMFGTFDDLYSVVTVSTGQGTIDISVGLYQSAAFSLATSLIDNAIDYI